MVDIVHRIGIRAPADKVYDAVATTRGVAGWWTRETTGSAAIGGQVNVRFHKDGKEIGDMDFEMTRLEPAREVRWRILEGPPEWVGTDVTFELAQDGEMTILNFGHRGWKEPVEFMHHCSTKWATFLMSLKALLETGTGAPAPSAAGLGMVVTRSPGWSRPPGARPRPSRRGRRRGARATVLRCPSRVD